MCYFRISKELNTSVSSAIADKKITPLEAQNIKASINQTNKDDSTFVSALLETKEKVTIGTLFSKKEIAPLALTFEAPSISEVRSGTFSMEKGQEGEAVSKTKKLLNIYDYKNTLAGNNFDDKLEEAIKTFQKEQNLPVTGVVDKNTFETLEKAKLKAPEITLIRNNKINLFENQKGDSIKDIHKLLNNYDFHLFLSGDEFNKDTTEAVKLFQKEQNLPITGVVDNKTLEALETAKPKLATLIELRQYKDNSEVSIKIGQKGESVAQINKLLNKIYPEMSLKGNEFTEQTENAVKKFQKNNYLLESGQVNGQLLHQMEEATKLDRNEIYKDPIRNSNIGNIENNFDTNTVKGKVASQLIEKGIEPESAFQVGTELVSAGKKWDAKMSSDSKCYTAVKRAIETSMNIPYKVYPKAGGFSGKWARTAGDSFLSKNSSFVKIEGLTRSELTQLPPGAIVVYKPKDKSEAGHIGIQDGNGKDISDKTRIQENVHRSASFEVYFPIKKAN